MNVLLVIDLQKQFRDTEGQYEKCLRYIKDHQNDYYVIGTLFRNFPDSMYVRHLGWNGCMNAAETDLEFHYDELLDKHGYSANQDLRLMQSRACSTAIKKDDSHMPELHYDIIGCDADACVLATSFDLWDRRYDFNILTDYVYTTAKDFTKEDIVKVMKRNFGRCVL